MADLLRPVYIYQKLSSFHFTLKPFKNLVCEIHVLPIPVEKYYSSTMLL